METASAASGSSRQQAWLKEVKEMVAKQPASSWTIARFKLSYAAEPGGGNLIHIDNVTAVGACPARALDPRIDRSSKRIAVDATFNQFDLRGISNVIGRFQVVLQQGKSATGHFRQRYADRLFPLHGEWEVPFMIRSRFGDLIPRPSDRPVVLKSAEPGEFAIPPLGSWFEKWEPIALVRADQPDGPTIAVIDHAMHCMISAGEKIATPPFFWHGEL